MSINIGADRISGFSTNVNRTESQEGLYYNVTNYLDHYENYPSLTGNGGKYLYSNGTSLEWRPFSRPTTQSQIFYSSGQVNIPSSANTIVIQAFGGGGGGNGGYDLNLAGDPNSNPFVAVQDASSNAADRRLAFNVPGNFNSDPYSQAAWSGTSPHVNPGILFVTTTSTNLSTNYYTLNGTSYFSPNFGITSGSYFKKGISYCPSFGRFSFIYGPTPLWSTDCSVWLKEGTIPGATGSNLQQIREVNGQLWALGENILSVSTDRIIWTNRTAANPANYLYYDIKYSDNNYIVCGRYGNVSVSTDGISWVARQVTSSAVGSTRLWNIDYWKVDQRHYIPAGTGGLITSTDTIVWTNVALSSINIGVQVFDTEHISSNLWIAGNFGGQSVGSLAKSTDGITWTLIPFNNSNYAYNVTASDVMTDSQRTLNYANGIQIYRGRVVVFGDRHSSVVGSSNNQYHMFATKYNADPGFGGVGGYYGEIIIPRNQLTSSTIDVVIGNGGSGGVGSGVTSLTYGSPGAATTVSWTGYNSLTYKFEAAGALSGKPGNQGPISGTNPGIVTMNNYYRSYPGSISESVSSSSGINPFDLQSGYGGNGAYSHVGSGLTGVSGSPGRPIRYYGRIFTNTGGDSSPGNGSVGYALTGKFYPGIGGGGGGAYDGVAAANGGAGSLASGGGGGGMCITSGGLTTSVVGNGGNGGNGIVKITWW